jgi:hypothetical protein
MFLFLFGGLPIIKQAADETEERPTVRGKYARGCTTVLGSAEVFHHPRVTDMLLSTVNPSQSVLPKEIPLGVIHPHKLLLHLPTSQRGYGSDVAQ